MGNSWDVIVVGARCAGATLAALLARQGVRTLLLEASPRGTDMPLSTHLVQPPGMGVLDEIGLGDRVRAVTPAVRHFRYALDDIEVLPPLPEGRYAHCVRRSVIDPWLQDAAEASGATLLDRHRVVDLVREGERVTGVVARGPGGKVTFSADLVVGADGMHSTVAKMTGVEEYLVTQGSRAGYWGYFPAPTRWDHEWDAMLEHEGDQLRYVFRCDGDLVTVVHVEPRERVLAWGKDYKARFLEAVRGAATTRRIVGDRQPVGKLLGLLKMRFFYRRPVGPGFALVGDAGHFKDFVTGQGMADAFLDAQRLSRAILDGRPEAFELYWRERDVATLPLHFDAIRQGEVGFNEPFMRWVIGSVAKHPQLVERMGLVFDRQITPDEFLGMKRMLRFVASALVHGRFDFVRGFLSQGRSRKAESVEHATRGALFREAADRLSQAPPAPRARPRRVGPVGYAVATFG